MRRVFLALGIAAGIGTIAAACGSSDAGSGGGAGAPGADAAGGGDGAWSDAGGDSGGWDAKDAPPGDSAGEAGGAAGDAPGDAAAGTGGSAGADGGGGAGGAGGQAGDGGMPGPCASETTKAKCLDCCINVEPSGAVVFLDALVACVCKSQNCEKPCSSSLCATNPKDPSPGDPCDTCAQGVWNGCGPEVLAACQKDPKCPDFVSCMNSSGCDKKP